MARRLPTHPGIVWLSEVESDLDEMIEQERQRQAQLTEEQRAQERSAHHGQVYRIYKDDPVAWVHDMIDWREGEGPATYQDEIMAAVPIHKRVSFRGPHTMGKAQPHALVIDTPKGKREFGDLKPRDWVFGSDGRPTMVTGVFERGHMDIYRVAFNDGTSTLCSQDHLWTVRKFDWKTKNDRETEWETLPLSAIMDHGVDRPNGKQGRVRKWAIPTVKPLAYRYQWVPVDPYTLGVWLGDGSKGQARITINDPEPIRRIERAGYSTSKSQNRDAQRSKADQWTIHGLMHGLRISGVYGCGSREKFVPKKYLENLIEVRKEVLRGLLDTDGTVTTWGAISFCSASRQLAQDVAWLARSLGGVARVHERQNDNGPWWNVQLTLPEDDWFYIQRKQERVSPSSRKRHLWRWIDSVEPVGSGAVRCISVTAQDGLYVANDGIVTHNTAMMAWVTLWYALTRDGSDDWKIPTTASAWRQLTKYLWPEIRKWARRLKWDKLARDPFDRRTELLMNSLKMSTGEAFAMTSDVPENMEGAHADRLLAIFDESKTIPAETFDALEGALSGQGEAFAMAGSTPGEPIGRFYEIHRRAPGTEDWWVRHVTMEEAIAAGRMSREWAEQRARQWGTGSAVYQNRVLGEFAASDEDSVIPLAWVEAAQDRWREIMDDAEYAWPAFTAVGVDVGSGSERADKTTLALRQGHIISEIRRFQRADTMETAGRVKGILDAHGGRAMIDAIGIGAGTLHRLREEKVRNVYAFLAGATPKTREGKDWKDRSGELGAQNVRSAAWWHLRELLDPTYNENIALPPDDTLTGDLTAPKYTVRGVGKIQVESKDELRTPERLGRSTDDGDSVIQAFWEPADREIDIPAPVGIPRSDEGWMR